MNIIIVLIFILSLLPSYIYYLYLMKFNLEYYGNRFPEGSYYCRIHKVYWYGSFDVEFIRYCTFYDTNQIYELKEIKHTFKFLEIFDFKILTNKELEEIYKNFKK